VTRRASSSACAASTAATRRASHFFYEAGLDYVSCSPFRVPVARLEAGRASLSPQAAAPTGADLAAVAVPAAVSTDGDFTVTKTASPTQVPLGGGSVTYTYTVKNNTGGRQYFVSAIDDKCSPVGESSGLSSTYDWWAMTTFTYIPANGTATFTCTQIITQDTTNTASFRFANSYSTGLFPGSYSFNGTSTGTATATVTVAKPDGTVKGCDALWYINDSIRRRGDFGTINTASAVQTPVAYTPNSATPWFNDGQNVGGGGAALAVDPTNPAKVYYVERDMDVSVTLANIHYYGLYVYDQVTGTHTLITTDHKSLIRLGMDATGVLWGVDTGGRLWSMQPTIPPPTPTWVDRGLVTSPTGTAISALSSGDIAFDGNGNMWFIGSDAAAGNTAYLYTITAASLAGNDGATATLIGAMGTGSYGGLAFGPDGTLYAEGVVNPTSTSLYSRLFIVNKETGSTSQQGGNVAGVMMSDLGSCALPKAVLRATKTVSPLVIAAGQKLTYTITVENLGNLAATNVKFVDPIPTGTTYVAGSAKLNGVQINTSTTFPYAAAREIHSVGDLNGVIGAQKTATITFEVTVDSGTVGEVCNTGTATYNSVNGTIKTDDPNQPGAEDFTCVRVLTPKIALDKTGSTTTMNSDGSPTTVVYTFAVTNPGTEPLRDVTLSDNKCSPVTLVSNGNGDAILTSDETWVYTCTSTLTVPTLNEAITTGIGVQSGITVTAKDTWNVIAPPLTIDKTSSATGQNVTPGDTITYTMVVRNSGTTDVTGVTLVDTLPTGVTYVPGSATKTYWTNQTTGGIQTGSYTVQAADWTPSMSMGFDPTNPVTTGTSQTFSTVGKIPANAILTGYSVNLKGTSAGARSNISLSATAPGGTGWFNVDRGGDIDNDEFGPASSGTWNTVTRSGSLSGNASGTYTLTWFDSTNNVTGLDNTVTGVDVTLNYTYDTTATSRVQVTNAAYAPPNMVTAADAITLKPGEAMTVTFKVTVDPGGVSTSLVNKATATSNETAPVTDSVTDRVVRPILDVAKQPGTFTGPDASGNYTVSYAVTVKNTGGATGTYQPITDTLGFDPAIKPVSASWTSSLGTSGGTTFTAAPYAFTMQSGPTSIAVGATHTYTVNVVFTYLGTSTVSACLDNTPGKGLYNSVSIGAQESSGDTTNNDACVPIPPQFAVKKAAAGGQPGGNGTAVTAAPDGTITATYTITVSNVGMVDGKPPAISDQLTLPSGFTITSVTVNGVTQPAGATFTIPAATVDLARGTSTAYTVVVTGRAQDIATADWTAAGTCQSEGAGVPAAGGFFNVVTMTGDLDGPNNNDACVPVLPPTAVINIYKYASHCDAGVPICPLAGAEFALYAVDPASVGAAPVANGFTVGQTAPTSPQRR
jgi:uncharacterized repeat protein (TIGR01451 family)